MSDDFAPPTDDRPVPVFPGDEPVPDETEAPDGAAALDDAAPAEPTARGVLALVPRWVRVLAVLIIIIGVAGYFIRVPYYSLGPGPARNVLEALTIRGAKTYPSKGQLLLTTASVSTSQLNVWDALFAWADPDVGLIPREALSPADETDEERDAANMLAMARSKLDAERAAFAVLGKTVVRIPGARVVGLLPDSPSEGFLKPGDLIVAVDGVRAASPEAAVAQIRKRSVGDPVRIRYVREGTSATATITTRGSLSDSSIPAIGVTVLTPYRFPNEVDIDTSEIGGPSGGLVFALSLIDALTPDDLTRGHVIAATGEIRLDETGNARVFPIGAVAEKIRSSRAVGADVLLIPAGNAAEARAHGTDGLTVIPVATLGDALDALRRLPERAARDAA